MTLGEGKRKVYQLLDEYTSGGTVSIDADVEKKMADFFDMAQKDVAQVKKLYRVATLTPEEDGGCAMPEDLVELCRVWKDGTRTERYDVIAGRFYPEWGGEAAAEYAAMPATIPEDAADEYEFEVAEDAAACMPYYVAAQVLLPDLVLDYSPYWNIYLMRRSALTPTERGKSSGALRQTLFRR